MPDVNLPLPFDAYAGEEPFVFVSYAHKDGHLVYPEIKALHESGVRIWFDGGIDPGNEWPEDIGKALLKAQMFLVFITPSSVESQNVRNEINFAINKKKPFLAVHLQETQLPVGLELRMGDIQAILKYRMTEENYNKKLSSTFSEVVVEKKSKTGIEIGLQESGKGRCNDERQDEGTPTTLNFLSWNNSQEFTKKLNTKLSMNVSWQNCWNIITKLNNKLNDSRSLFVYKSFWFAVLKLSFFILLALWTSRKVNVFMFEPHHDNSIFSGYFFIGVCFVVWWFTIRNGLDLIKIIKTNGVKPTRLFLLVLVLLGLFVIIVQKIITYCFYS